MELSKCEAVHRKAEGNIKIFVKKNKNLGKKRARKSGSTNVPIALDSVVTFGKNESFTMVCMLPMRRRFYVWLIDWLTDWLWSHVNSTSNHVIVNRSWRWDLHHVEEIGPECRSFSGFDSNVSATDRAGGSNFSIFAGPVASERRSICRTCVGLKLKSSRATNCSCKWAEPPEVQYMVRIKRK